MLVARDTCWRDIASVHGTYRKVQETIPALELVGQTLAALKVGPVVWLLDKPVSNSGRLAAIVREVASSHEWKWDARIEFNPDAILSESPHVIATADSAILDRSRPWLSLARLVVCKHIPNANVVDISGHVC